MAAVEKQMQEVKEKEKAEKKKFKLKNVVKSITANARFLGTTPRGLSLTSSTSPRRPSVTSSRSSSRRPSNASSLPSKSLEQLQETAHHATTHHAATHSEEASAFNASVAAAGAARGALKHEPSEKSQHLMKDQSTLLGQSRTTSNTQLHKQQSSQTIRARTQGHVASASGMPSRQASKHITRQNTIDSDGTGTTELEEKRAQLGKESTPHSMRNKRTQGKGLTQMELYEHIFREYGVLPDKLPLPGDCVKEEKGPRTHSSVQKKRSMERLQQKKLSLESERKFPRRLQISKQTSRLAHGAGPVIQVCVSLVYMQEGDAVLMNLYVLYVHPHICMYTYYIYD
jgi:hypothetical protein